MKNALSAVLLVLLSTPCIADTIAITAYGATANAAGDDDSPAINAAVQAAQSGDSVIVPEGTFHLRAPIGLKSGVEIRGAGADVSILAALYGGYHTQLMQGAGISDVTVANLGLEGRGEEGIASLVYLKNATDIDIVGGRFDGFLLNGVYFNDTAGGRVRGSLFQGATATDPGGHGYGVVFTNGSHRGRVDDSRFIGPQIRHGVVIQGNKIDWNPSHDIVVKNNYFENTTQDAIDLHGAGEYANYIVYNTIVGDPDSEILGRGIGVGEEVHGASGPGNVVMFNTISSTRYGIHVLKDTAKVTIRYNTILDCKRHGIYVQAGRDIDIRDNVVSGCQKWGVYVQDGHGIVIRRASSNGNLINHNGVAGPRYGGVRVDAGSTGLLIQDNDFCDNDLYGGVNLSFDGYGVIGTNQCQ